ncbi:hypothetical protein GDO81_028783 [Engystomops pustulosus]|uniref:Uncharacterized protein n=1 Tax=Engystomops pustulosus TaxID=76066 RepID=A0AAV6YJG4_ENGPU|nr:hypothetical protein GDO81_028783 [Engystomops pustulosus]
MKDTCCTDLCVDVSGDCDSLRSWRICCSPCSSGFHSYSMLRDTTRRGHSTGEGEAAWPGNGGDGAVLPLAGY